MFEDECFEGGQVGAFTGGGRYGRGSTVHEKPLSKVLLTTVWPKKHQNLGWMKGEGDEGFFFLLTFLDFFLDFHSNFID